VIRRLSKVAQDGPDERRFVETLLVICGGNWDHAQDIWEQTVEKELDTKKVRNDLRRAERASIALLSVVISTFGHLLDAPPE
jgi:hypothetical protein